MCIELILGGMKISQDFFNLNMDPKRNIISSNKNSAKIYFGLPAIYLHFTITTTTAVCLFFEVIILLHFLVYIHLSRYFEKARAQKMENRTLDSFLEIISSL